jgi:1-phosphatidylinositol-4-phosphate 5-kinase
MIFKAGEGAGRSGSFFFFSHDQNFVVKTITNTELQLIKKMMPKYTKYLEENPKSLLCKILGIFTVEAESFNQVHIMLMENTIRLKNPTKLKYVFDLKGSMVDRTVTGKT